MSKARSKTGWSGLLIGIGLVDAGVVAAHAVERNPPIPLVQPAPAPAGTHDIAGMVLTAVVISGDDGRISLAGLPFVGQPLSPALIRRLEAFIDRRLADAGRPAVARFVEVPDATPGVVTFSVVPASVGMVKVTGAPPAEAQAIQSKLGLEPGAAVDPVGTAIALDSLNRYPFRQVAVTFAAQAAPGVGTVAATVTEQKPWQFTAGAKYAGSSALTRRRLFAGITVGDWLGQDSVLAFLATAAPNAIDRTSVHPEYEDGALTYTRPVSRDGVVEAGIDVTGQLFHYPPDDYWLIEVDGTLDYRRYLYDATGQGVGDVRVGIEARHERVRTITGGMQVGDESEEMYELYAGYHRLTDTARTHDEGDISLHVSPGGVDPGNGDAHFAKYSGDRMRSARYAYADVNFDHAQALGASLSWHAQLSAQLATGPMPYYVQGAVGGVNNVRGYFLYDGALDDVVILRNEVGPRSKVGGLAPNLFMFLDVGSGYDAQLHTTKTLASTGLGASYTLTRHTMLSVDVAHALLKGTITAPGTNAVEANLTYKY